MRRWVWMAAVVPWFVLTVGCTPLKATPYDFDGDGRADRVVIDVSTGRWSSIDAGDTFEWQGQAGDYPVPGDYDADGHTDVVVVRGGDWIRSDGAIIAHLPAPAVATYPTPYGSSQPHAYPVPGDYDGDGRTEPAWYQDDTATWTFSDGTTRVLGHGPTDPTACCFANLDADIPVPADYDGDGTTDLAVYDPVHGRWLIHNSHDDSDRTLMMGGNPGVDVQALPIPADYDGVGHAQPALFTPYGWIIEGHPDKASFVPQPATASAFPAPADYDGVGHDQLSYLTLPTGPSPQPPATWAIAGRWTTPGFEPATVPQFSAPNVNLAAAYPFHLVATVARVILVDKNFWACDHAQMTGPDCIVPA